MKMLATPQDIHIDIRIALDSLGKETKMKMWSWSQLIEIKLMIDSFYL